MTNALATYIAARNEGKQFALVEDIAHWESMGITSPDELEAYLAWCGYCDHYKSEYGIKPRWTHWRDADAEEWGLRIEDMYSVEELEEDGCLPTEWVDPDQGSFGNLGAMFADFLSGKK